LKLIIENVNQATELIKFAKILREFSQIVYCLKGDQKPIQDPFNDSLLYVLSILSS